MFGNIIKLGLITLLTYTSITFAKEQVSKNNIYGMASGAALLIDVYHPTKTTTKHRAIVMVPGSGWYAEEGYDANGLKEMDSGWLPGDELAKAMVNKLVAGGYTVFVPNHRAAPKYRYPTANNDIARAVRYIRQNAKKYSVSKDSIGGMGTSSGGSLVSLLGVDDQLAPESRLQAIATLGSPMDLIAMYYASVGSAGTVVSYMGRAINFLPSEHPDVLLYKQASTIAHIGGNDAPHLLIHGADDELVPISQSQNAASLFEASNIPVEVIEVPNGKHSENLLQDNDFWLPKIVEWMDQHL